MASTVVETTPQEAHASIKARPWLAVRTLCGREWIRFIRQRNRVFGAIGQPVIFWLLFSAGLGPAFHLPRAVESPITFREYFFPGTVVLILLFTAIFTTISVIEDRREGFLQSVLVAPIPRWSMVLGKLLGGTLLAFAQALLFLAAGALIGIHFQPAMLLAVVVLLFVSAFSLTGLGFVIAWRMDSTQGFHAVMSVLLMPMWLLSGAFFPSTAGPLYWVMLANPLSYAVAGLRHLLFWDQPRLVPAQLPSLPICWIVTVVFAVCMFALSWHAAGRRTTGDLL